MYIDDVGGDAIQTGYVITGLYEFYNDNTGNYSNQFIDLWININIIKSAFEECENIVFFSFFIVFFPFFNF